MELNRPQLRPLAKIAGVGRGARPTDVLTAPRVKGRIPLTMVPWYASSEIGPTTRRLLDRWGLFIVQQSCPLLVVTCCLASRSQHLEFSDLRSAALTHRVTRTPINYPSGSPFLLFREKPSG